MDFHKITQSERLKQLQVLCDLSDDELASLQGEKGLTVQHADHLIENIIGVFALPLGVATHLVIDGQERMIPMAVEETSVIAAVSSTAKWITRQGQLTTRLNGEWIIGQIQIPRVRDIKATLEILNNKKIELITLANRVVPSLVERGGGIRDVEFRRVQRPDEIQEMLVIHILCDPCDAMGANLINQVCEVLKPCIEDWTQDHVGLCILSNLVDTKRVQADVRLRDCDPTIADGIMEAYLFAKADPYRACTHNKGIMNGIDPVLIATGNDWRAVEAAAHAYAARNGRYEPLTKWWMEGKDLCGRLELPMALGIVGGVTKIHPTVKTNLKIMRVRYASDLARICAAVGLVQNLGALKALSGVGIVQGHMKLHASNLALSAGAKGDGEITWVKNSLIETLKTEKRITLSTAQSLLQKFRSWKTNESG